MRASTVTVIPRAWIGCLACYNAGRLVGGWHDAIEADDITIADVHGRSNSHEDLWCFDLENIPVNREMSPSEAAEWGRLFDECGEYQREALYAWLKSGDYDTVNKIGLPLISEFEDLYCGQWPSFRDYSDDFVVSTGLLHNVSDEVKRFFDYESYPRELAYDFTTVDAHAGVFVFRS